MAKNKKKSSSNLASEAARVLGDKTASKIEKSLAASVLSQKDKSKQTGAALEEKASKVLKSDRYKESTRAFAASVVSQSNKNR